jgi:hypothetical protein
MFFISTSAHQHISTLAHCPRHFDRSERSERSGEICRQTQRPQSRQVRTSADPSTPLRCARDDEGYASGACPERSRGARHDGICQQIPPRARCAGLVGMTRLLVLSSYFLHHTSYIIHQPICKLCARSFRSWATGRCFRRA